MELEGGLFPLAVVVSSPYSRSMRCDWLRSVAMVNIVVVQIGTTWPLNCQCIIQEIRSCSLRKCWYGLTTIGISSDLSVSGEAVFAVAQPSAFPRCPGMFLFRLTPIYKALSALAGLAKACANQASVCSEPGHREDDQVWAKIASGAGGSGTGTTRRSKYIALRNILGKKCFVVVGVDSNMLRIKEADLKSRAKCYTNIPIDLRGTLGHIKVNLRSICGHLIVKINALAIDESSQV
ncbi:hypothetical protein RRG08_029385 [Elysia crispata]|uniref:Uncharacterized protein n=1 Tax=Elysia crispata TaxID=231223 RepID=A0AAE1B7P2_9GAST|nr:hypothetical protein RRG08_029385 [Elysia crispata]